MNVNIIYKSLMDYNKWSDVQYSYWDDEQEILGKNMNEFYFVALGYFFVALS